MRSILETALLDTMFDLPEMSGVEEVVVNGEVIMQSAKPLLVQSEKSREPQKAGA